eukprot:gene2704-3123_t
MKRICCLFMLLCTLSSYAQPFRFKSTGPGKPFFLNIGWGEKGKGAYVWYEGQNSPMALQVSAYKRDKAQAGTNQPDEESYRWTEIYQGKINGTYALTMMQHNIYQVSYVRARDNKKFELEYLEDKKPYDGKNMLLLYGIQLHFYVFYKNDFKLLYADGQETSFKLSPLKNGNARQYFIRDYNNDGYDDISFKQSGAKAEIFIYHRQIKKFMPQE